MTLLAACRSGSPPSGITVLIESPPDSIDDRMALSANGQRIAQLITPGLVTFNDESEPVPDLAESFRWVDDRTLEFTLRPGLTFHDGSALTTADVKATYEALLDRTLPSPRADKLEPVASIEAVDDRVLRLHLKRAYAPMLAELTIGIVPEERANDIAAQGRAPIGAGPFRFVAQPDEEHLELAPFDGYYGGKPDIRALHLRVVRDETTRVLELLKGRADLVVNAVSPAVLPMLTKQPGIHVLTRPGTGYAYIGFNVRQGPLSDPRVRRAICHLVRTEPIVEYKFHGLAVPATGMIPKSHWAYTPTAGCRYDPAEAARLLDEAGYPDPDGPGGQPRLTISYKTSTDRFRKSIALVLKQELEEGGIAIDLRALEFGTFFSDVRKGNFEMVTLKWGAVVEPDLMRWVFSSGFIPTAENHFGGLNRAGYADPEVDAALARASAAVTREERKALYAEVLRALDRDLPNVPLWHETSVAIVSDRLRGYSPSAHGFFTPLAKAHQVDGAGR
ncbi:MAG: ABC transporter substrate-binding protein [Myxococcaceae bacterium]|nr:ABC transporter substrate-binding protein [Myxococcaceae bacterium]